MKVYAEIKNVPDYAKEKDGFLVVRKTEDASLWFYGLYDSEERAKAVAIEIGNGFVLKKGEN